MFRVSVHSLQILDGRDGSKYPGCLSKQICQTSINSMSVTAQLELELMWMDNSIHFRCTTAFRPIINLLPQPNSISHDLGVTKKMVPHWICLCTSRQARKLIAMGTKITFKEKICQHIPSSQKFWISSSHCRGAKQTFFKISPPNGKLLILTWTKLNPLPWNMG